MLRDLDMVQREEFEAVKAMMQKAREENAKLKKRVRTMLKQINRDNTRLTRSLARYLLMAPKPPVTS